MYRLDRKSGKDGRSDGNLGATYREVMATEFAAIPLSGFIRNSDWMSFAFTCWNCTSHPSWGKHTPMWASCDLVVTKHNEAQKLWLIVANTLQETV